MNNYIIKFILEKEGLFKKRLDSKKIDLMMESCYGNGNVEGTLSTKELSFYKVKSNLSIQSVIDQLTTKIKETFPETTITFEVEGNETYYYKFGKKSTISICNEADEQKNLSNGLNDINETEYNNLLNQIDHLIGWDSYKQFSKDFLGIAKEMYKHKSTECIRSLNYLISVNDGCGLTNILELMTLQGVNLGIFDKKFYYEYTLSDESEGPRISFRDLFEIIYDTENHGKLMCLDISEYLEKSKRLELKDLLMELEHYSDKFNFVFRIPYIEPKELKEVENTLSDILFIKTFVIPPYTDKEITEYAQRQLENCEFKMDKSAWEIFRSRIREEKSDGRFYGLRTVKKVCDEIILLKHQSDISQEHINDTITKKDILPLSKSYGTKSKDAFEELNELIGMEKIAERIKEIVTQVKTAAENDKLEKPCMHMRFVGAPGTGKTTVARIIGKIFAENHILSNGYFFEYSARDFCGQYVGQTAPKTAEICRDAYGSVLFIDEAYDLYRGSYMTDNDFGREALTTLIAEMENHRDNLVVIMAGYSKEMDTLMEGNIGLRSRMPFIIEFPSYTQEQLFRIFMLMAKKKFNCKDDLEPCVKKYFLSLPQDYIDSQEFSNARFVRNLYERTWSKAAMRTQLEGKDNIDLCAEDFIAASQEKEFSEKLTATRSKVGF